MRKSRDARVLSHDVPPSLLQGYIQRGEFTLGIVDGTKYKSWLEHFELDSVRCCAQMGACSGSSKLYSVPIE